MTKAGNDGSAHAGVAEHLTAVDELLTLPFPEEDYRDGDGFGGPGHRVLVLAETRDFWDDPPPEVVEAAEAEIEAQHDALASELSARWGPPEKVELWRYLSASIEEDFSPPEPIISLCQSAGSMLVWRPPGTGRWLGLTIGQNDTEFPLELSAATSDLETLIPAPEQ